MRQNSIGGQKGGKEFLVPLQKRGGRNCGETQSHFSNVSSWEVKGMANVCICAPHIVREEEMRIEYMRTSLKMQSWQVRLSQWGDISLLPPSH